MMERIFNHRLQKPLRQKLRREPTFPEMILWKYLRNQQFQGCKFRRQHGIGPYIVDFYCPSLHLVIEVDGDSHDETEQKEKDHAREQYLSLKGISLFRCQNSDVVSNTEGVFEHLRQFVETLCTQPPPNSPSERGRDTA